jgi:hypothetical protein
VEPIRRIEPPRGPEPLDRVRPLTPREREQQRREREQRRRERAARERRDDGGPPRLDVRA